MINLMQNRPDEERPKNQQNAPGTLCDPENFTVSEVRILSPADPSVLKRYCQNLKAARNKLSDSNYKKDALLAANFLGTEIENIVTANASKMRFLRFYVGIDDNGQHVAWVAPIGFNNKPIVAEGTTYAMQCCGYPPHTSNFSGDTILELK